MKNTPLILSVIALGAVIVLGITQLLGGGKSNSNPTTGNQPAENGTIVYFNLDRVLQEYDMANDLSSVVEAKVQGIQQEVNRRGNNLQKKMNDLQEKANKGLITRSVAEVQAQKIAQEQQEFEAFAAQKQQEIIEEQQVSMNQIANAIKEYVDKYNADKQFSLIISTQGDILPAPVVSGDASLDITDELIAGLNEEYVRTKAKQNE